MRSLNDEAVAQRHEQIRDGHVRLPSRQQATSQLFVARSTEHHVGRL